MARQMGSTSKPSPEISADLRSQCGERRLGLLEGCRHRRRDRPARRRGADEDAPAEKIALGLGQPDIIRQRTADRPRVALMRAGHGLQHQGGIRDAAGHRRHVRVVAECVRHLAVRDRSQALLQPNHAIAGRRDTGGAAAIRRHRNRADATRHGNGGAAAGAAGAVAGAPGIAGAAEQRRVGQAFGAEFRCGGLAEQNGAVPAQPRHRFGILRWHILRQQERAEGRAHALRVDDVLDAAGNAMQQAERLAAHHRLLRLGGRLQGSLRRQGDEAVQHRLQPLGAGENGAGQLGRRNLLAPDQEAKLGCRQKAEIVLHACLPL